jgi:hypothetical protein
VSFSLGPVLPALLVSWLILSVVPAAAAPPPEGTLVVTSDLEMLGWMDLGGGGRVTWTLSGEQAQVLRRKVVALYDDYPAIPRGFKHAFTATRATPNDMIDIEEAELFGAHLENELEGFPDFGGTSYRYGQILRADKIEKDRPIGFSTTGLVGAAANSTDPLEIRFLFNAETAARVRDYRLADVSLAHALHSVFDFRAEQTFDDGEAWPLIPVAPWTLNGTTGVLGASSQGTYPANADAAVSTAALDLRMASEATLRFRHWTTYADPNDRVLVEGSRDGVSWTLLEALPNTAQWTESSLDLGDYVGGKLWLRFRLVTDGSGNAGVVALDDFLLDAPSRFEGTVEVRHADYLVGLLSFADPDVPSGQTHLLRTPAGEILWYSARYDVGAPPDDQVVYRAFDPMESPQILFAVVVAAGYILAAVQRRAYFGYRRAFPPVRRREARRVRGLHWLGRGTILALVLLYFLPSLPVLFGLRVYVMGLSLWILSVAATAGVGTYTLMHYRKLKARAPVGVGRIPRAASVPPPPPSPAEPFCPHCDRPLAPEDDILACSCGERYHTGCASTARECVACALPLPIPEPAPLDAVPAICPSCGEIQAVPADADLVRTPCRFCRAVLGEIEPGRLYLVLDGRPDLAFGWFRSLAHRPTPALCVSPTFPERLRRAYGLADVEFHWLNEEEGPGTLNPRRLAGDVTRTVTAFVKAHPGSVVLLDGLPVLAAANGFDPALRFVKAVGDLCRVHGVTLIVPVAPETLSSEQIARIRGEFDRVEEPESV